MKKKTIIIIVVIALLVLLVPIPTAYRDGGTRDYKALLYRVVVWNRFYSKSTEEDNLDIYHKTSFYLFPLSNKSIDALWELEMAKN